MTGTVRGAATVVDLAGPVAAVRCLSQALHRPGAAAVRARLDGGVVAVSALTGDLLRVVYRLAFAVEARRRGGLLTDTAATAALRLDVLPSALLDPELL